MQNILKMIVLLSALLPYQGFCSYVSKASDFKGKMILSLPICEGRMGEENYCLLEHATKGLDKCLLMIDMIKEATTPHKINHLKTILEVELLTISDQFLYRIELWEQDIAHATDNFPVQEAIKEIEWLRRQRDIIKDLLKYTL